MMQRTFRQRIRYQCAIELVLDKNYFFLVGYRPQNSPFLPFSEGATRRKRDPRV